MKDRTQKPTTLRLVKETVEDSKALDQKMETAYQTSSFKDTDLDCLPRRGITIFFTNGFKPSCWVIG